MIVTIIIPAFNEESSLRAVLDSVLAADTAPFGKEIIVVDDGSTDGTAPLLNEYARERGINVFRHATNRGKAASIRTALQQATGAVILIQDADLEYSPDDYRRLLQPFHAMDSGAVYGSRFLQARWPRNMRPQNWLANKLFTFLTNLLYGARLTDEGTAYKAFTAGLIRSLAITCSGFEFCPEVTAKLLKRRIPIIEVPVSYTARSKKEGKKPGIRDGLKILWTIVRYRFTD